MVSHVELEIRLFTESLSVKKKTATQMLRVCESCTTGFMRTMESQS